MVCPLITSIPCDTIKVVGVEKAETSPHLITTCPTLLILFRSLAISMLLNSARSDLSICIWVLIPYIYKEGLLELFYFLAPPLEHTHVIGIHYPDGASPGNIRPHFGIRWRASYHRNSPRLPIYIYQAFSSLSIDRETYSTTIHPSNIACACARVWGSRTP